MIWILTPRPESTEALSRYDQLAVDILKLLLQAKAPHYPEKLHTTLDPTFQNPSLLARLSSKPPESRRVGIPEGYEKNPRGGKVQPRDLEVLLGIVAFRLQASIEGFGLARLHWLKPYTARRNLRHATCGSDL